MIKERKFLLLNHKCHRKLKSLVEDKKYICKNEFFQQLPIRLSKISLSSLRNKKKIKILRKLSVEKSFRTDGNFCKDFKKSTTFLI